MFYLIVILLSLFTGSIHAGEINGNTDDYKYFEESESRKHYNLGWAYAIKNMPKEAIEEFKASIKEDPKFADSYFYLGLLYAAENKLDEAVKECLSAIKINPSNARFHYGIAEVYSKKEMIKEAFAEQNLAIKYDSSFPEAYYGLGTLFLKTGDKKAATDNFYKAGTLFVEDKRETEALMTLAEMKKSGSKELTEKLDLLIKKEFSHENK